LRLVIGYEFKIHGRSS